MVRTIVIVVLLSCTTSLIAQRTPTGFIDAQTNTVSQVQMRYTNTGILGGDTAGKRGNIWMRNSNNTYIYGAGLWFGGTRRGGQKFSVISYNPSKSSSWMMPMKAPDGLDSVLYSRVAFSPDYAADGMPKDGKGYPWALWRTPAKPMGEFVADPTKRNISSYPLGPAVVSDEDVHCRYDDRNVKMYDDTGVDYTAKYPVGLLFDQRSYSFASATALQDVIFVRVEVTNTGTDTLRNCSIGAMADIDHGIAGSTQNYQTNDRISVYQDNEIMLGYGYTSPNIMLSNERNKGLGYIGLAMIAYPPGKSNLSDDYSYTQQGTLSLPVTNSTLKNWIISQDPKKDDGRTDFLNSKVIDGDLGPGDRRILNALNNIHLLPGQSFSFVYAYIYAFTAKGGEADGTTDDIVTLVDLAKLAKKAYRYFESKGVITSVSEQDAAENNDIILSPSPSQTQCTITATKAIERVMMYDVLGNIVSRAEASTEQRLTLSTAHLASGTYPVVIQFTDGTQQVRQLMVLR